jgi:hypothetical protein
VLGEATLEELDAVWEEIKASEKRDGRGDPPSS